jgi:hypothetical protein
MKKRKGLGLKMEGLPPPPLFFAKSAEVLDSERVAKIIASKSA